MVGFHLQSWLSKQKIKSTLALFLTLLPTSNALAQFSIDNTFHDELKAVVAQKLGINPNLNDPNYMILEVDNPVSSDNGQKLGATVSVWLGGAFNGSFLSLIRLDAAGNPVGMDIKQRLTTVPKISRPEEVSQSLGPSDDISPDMVTFVDDVAVQVARQYLLDVEIKPKSVNNNGDMVVKTSRFKATDDGSFLDQLAGVGLTAFRARQALYLSGQTTPIILAHQDYSNRLACSEPELASITPIEGLNLIGQTTQRTLSWTDPQYGSQTATYFYPATSACQDGPFTNYALASGQSRRLLANMAQPLFKYRAGDLGFYNMYNNSEQVILETPANASGTVIKTGKSLQDSMPESQFGEFNLAKYSPDGEFGISPSGRFIASSSSVDLNGQPQNRIVRVDTLNNTALILPVSGAPSSESTSLASPKVFNDGTVAGTTQWSNGVKRMNIILPSGVHLIGSYPADATSCDAAGIARGRVFGTCTIQNGSGTSGPIGYFWNYSSAGVSSPQKLNTIVPLAAQGFDPNSALPLYSVGRAVIFTTAYHPQFGYRQIRLILN